MSESSVAAWRLGGTEPKVAVVLGTRPGIVKFAPILHRLQEIMKPEAPLTKAEAWERCLAEVPRAYPAGLEKAWAKLDPSCKRGRGKHGRRREFPDGKPSE